MTIDENQISALSLNKNDIYEQNKKIHCQETRADTYEHQASSAQHESFSSPSEIAPIHRLPPEILSPIFLDIVGTAIWFPRTTLSGVCRRWREIVNGMKCLWNEVLIRDLNRSKGLGVCFSLHCDLLPF
jgi:hypothetical protein